MFMPLVQMRGSSRLLLISFIFFVFSVEVVSSKTHTIYWNASNPLFTSGDYEINVRLGDQIKIVCPQLRSTMEDDDGAYLIIQKDSEMAHMNCVLESPRQVAVCSKPKGEIFNTFIVRKYRLSTYGLEFEPGQTHYFLSTSRGTSDQDGMDKKMGGMCKHEHMRMKIHVDELDPSTVIDSTRSPYTSTASTHPPSRFSVPVTVGGGRRIPHEPRRHTKKEHEVPHLERFSESDMPTLYTYHTNSQEASAPDSAPSGWEAVKMNADEMVGDLRGGYGYPDYIISEHSSSTTFSLVLLSILLLISLR